LTVKKGQKDIYKCQSKLKSKVKILRLIWMCPVNKINYSEHHRSLIITKIKKNQFKIQLQIGKSSVIISKIMDYLDKFWNQKRLLRIKIKKILILKEKSLQCQAFKILLKKIVKYLTQVWEKKKGKEKNYLKQLL